MGWGDNIYGELGDSSYTSRNTPEQIGSATNWSAISAGGANTIALKTDGTLWAWGDNTYGELGDGTNTTRNTPVQIGTSTNWAFINAANFTVGIKSDGTLWAWGYNSNGELGDGTHTNKNAPEQIGSATNWKNVSVNGNNYGGFNIAIKTDGTLWVWGYNGQGELGDGSYTNKNAPEQIGTDTTWSIASAGDSHIIALKTAIIASSSQTITTGATQTTICPGATIYVPFTVSGTFQSGNTFTAQLSNSSGNFNNATSIGTLNSSNSGTVTCTIPNATAAGTGYRIRIVASSPLVIGTDNGTNIIIISLPTPSISGSLETCANGITSYIANDPGAVSQAWTVNGGTIKALIQVIM